MLKSKKSYRQQFNITLRDREKVYLILMDRGNLCFYVLDVLKLAISFLCASSRMPSVITMGHGDLGHIRPAYKSREKTHHSPKKLGDIRHVQEEQDEGDSEFSLFSNPSHGMSKSYTVMFEVTG